MNRREALAAPFAALALLLALAVAGCSPPPTPEPTPTPVPTATTEPTTTPPEVQPAALADIDLALEPVARGLDSPLYVTHAGDGSGRLFVVEQPGRVRVIRDGRVQDGAFLDVSRRITAGGERGLLGMAFSPDYADSGEFFVNYTDLNGDTVVARFTADDPADDTPKLSGPATILKIDQPYANHNGGCILFQPGTRRMWVGTGDGGSGGDPHGNAQNSRSLLGKMLVLDFASPSERPKPRIVQRGLRNPWRFSFDRETRDLWIGDVGQNSWEEIDFVRRDRVDGVNWGWNRWEGTHPYPPGTSRSRGSYRFPITDYGREDGGSVTGGFVYRGSDYPELYGTYLYADYLGGWVAGLQRQAPDGSFLEEPITRRLIDEPISPSSFGEDERGEMYLCDLRGSVYRIVVR